MSRLSDRERKRHFQFDCERESALIVPKSSELMHRVLRSSDVEAYSSEKRSIDPTKVMRALFLA